MRVLLQRLQFSNRSFVYSYLYIYTREPLLGFFFGKSEQNIEKNVYRKHCLHSILGSFLAYLIKALLVDVSVVLYSKSRIHRKKTHRLSIFGMRYRAIL